MLATMLLKFFKGMDAQVSFARSRSRSRSLLHALSLACVRAFCSPSSLVRAHMSSCKQVAQACVICTCARINLTTFANPFHVYAHAIAHQERLKAMAELFNKYDVDGQGSIDRDEFRFYSFAMTL